MQERLRPWFEAVRLHPDVEWLFKSVRSTLSTGAGMINLSKNQLYMTT